MNPNWNTLSSYYKCQKKFLLTFHRQFGFYRQITVFHENFRPFLAYYTVKKQKSIFIALKKMVLFTPKRYNSQLLWSNTLNSLNDDGKYNILILILRIPFFIMIYFLKWSLASPERSYIGFHKIGFYEWMCT